MSLDIETVNMFCDESEDLLLRWENICLELMKNPTDQLLQELFRIAHNIKGGSRAVGLVEFGDVVHKVEDGITLLRDKQVSVNQENTTQLLQAQQILLQWVTDLRKNPEHKVNAAQFLEKYSSVFGHVGAHQPGPARETTVVAPPEEKNAPVLIQEEAAIANPPEPLMIEPEQKTSTLQKQNKAKQSRNPNETLRVASGKLDQLIQTIGELSIHQSIIWHSRFQSSKTSQKVIENSVQLSQKLTKELYDYALGLRMQPLQTLFQRLERNIVDLSTQLGKEVTVEVLGGDVELDKSVIEKILDPLTHMVRNAIDHGIENPADRIINSKPQSGKIVIEAAKDTFGVEIRIQDDGKGMNAEKIRKKALEKGLIKESAQLGKQELLSLIFLPGFSTAEKITDVSGRGVGMDVVRRTIEELNGNVKIDSEEGLGSTFQITLPTSVNIVEAIVFELCEQRYVIPLSNVEEVVHLKTSAVEINGKVLRLRDELVPLVDLKNYLRSSTRGQESERSCAIVCKVNNHKFGFTAHKIVGQQQIVVRPLNDNLDGVFGIMGGTILGNGEPGLILDMPAVMNRHLELTKEKEVAA